MRKKNILEDERHLTIRNHFDDCVCSLTVYELANDMIQGTQAIMMSPHSSHVSVVHSIWSSINSVKGQTYHKRM